MQTTYDRSLNHYVTGQHETRTQPIVHLQLLHVKYIATTNLTLVVTSLYYLNL